MKIENKYEQILDQFVDAMNAGEDLPIDELLSEGGSEIAEMLPLLDFIAWFKVSSADVAEKEKSAIKNIVLQSGDEQENWSMQRLLAASKPDAIRKAKRSGMTQQQIDMLSADTTPINIDSPNNVVRGLSEKYEVKFLNLLGWVRQLITDAISTGSYNNMSPAFTRQEKRWEDADDNADSDN